MESIFTTISDVAPEFLHQYVPAYAWLTSWTGRSRTMAPLRTHFLLIIHLMHELFKSGAETTFNRLIKNIFQNVK